MSEEIDEIPRAPMQRTHGCLVVSLQVDLRDAVLQQFQKDLLERTRVLQPKGIILDISGLTLFDSHEFAALRRAMDMARLMGCATVLVGMQPGLAASIAEIDVNCDELLTARSLEEAFELIDRVRMTPPLNGGDTWRRANIE
jgi:rsbT antagonist protein RsbS